MSIEDRQAELYNKYENIHDQLDPELIKEIEEEFKKFGDWYENDDIDIEMLEELLDDIEDNLSS